MPKTAIRADLLDFTGTPSWGSPTDAGVRFRPDHWLLLDEAGRIQGAQQAEPGPDWQRHDHRGRLLMPGFIDSHVHAPQLDVIGSWGTSHSTCQCRISNITRALHIGQNNF